VITDAGGGRRAAAGVTCEDVHERRHDTRPRDGLGLLTSDTVEAV